MIINMHIPPIQNSQQTTLNKQTRQKETETKRKEKKREKKNSKRERERAQQEDRVNILKQIENGCGVTFQPGRILCWQGQASSQFDAGISVSLTVSHRPRIRRVLATQKGISLRGPLQFQAYL